MSNVFIEFRELRKRVLVMIKFTEVLNQIYEFKKIHRVCWFRGHSNANYKLNSGLYRISDDLEEIKSTENDIYNCFINYGDSYCNNFHANKEWNSLFLMQHYGMYTRLLDWTDSFITALYFAIKDKKQDIDACIWMIDPISINNRCSSLYEQGKDNRFDNIGLLTVDTLPERISSYIGYFDDYINIGTFSMVPRRSNTRLVSQNGFFTVQGTKGISLEEEFKECLNDLAVKIIISEEIVQECKEFLKINGINHYTLYGGVDGLCGYIKNELLDIKLKNM